MTRDEEEFRECALDEQYAALVDAIRAKHQGLAARDAEGIASAILTHALLSAYVAAEAPTRCALCGTMPVRAGVDHEVWIATWTRSGHVLGRKPETWCANCARLDQLTATGA